MRTSDIIRRAGRNLRQAKGRTILTALAISVGAFTLTLSLAIGAGTRSYFAKVMETNINKQSLVVYADKSLLGVSTGASALKEYDPNAATYGGGYSYKTLGADDLKKLENESGISTVIPGYDVQAEYFQFEGNAKKYTSAVYAYDSTVRSDAAAGSIPALGKQLKDDQIVLPEAYLKTLGIKKASDALGKKITIHVVRPQQQLSEAQLQQIYMAEGMEGITNATKSEEKDVTYTIVAVSAKPATALAATNQLSISLNQAKDLSEYLTNGTKNYQRYMAVTVLAKDGVDPASLRDRLKGDNLYAMTAEDLQGMLFTLVNVMQGIVAGFGVLALLASVFGIINTQYISVLERTSQIGLMKALGMSNRAIGKLFRYEAAWIGFLGGVIGSGLAVLLGILLNPVITEKLKLGEGNDLLIFQPLPIIGLLLLLVVIAIVAGWFPSRKAAKLDPIEALRTE
jgi:putative ABC transport system permease protein